MDYLGISKQSYELQIFWHVLLRVINNKKSPGGKKSVQFLNDCLHFLWK